MMYTAAQYSLSFRNYWKETSTSVANTCYRGIDGAGKRSVVADCGDALM
jgi:hypothetical protein